MELLPRNANFMHTEMRYILIFCFIRVVVFSAESQDENFGSHPIHPIERLTGFHKAHSEEERFLHHSFTHNCSKTNSHAHLRYNVTRSTKRHVELQGITRLICTTPTRITAAFETPQSMHEFLFCVAPGTVLSSNRKCRCEGTGLGILLKIVSVLPLNTTWVYFEGVGLKSHEMFRDAKVHFSTDIISAHHPPKVPFSRKGKAKLERKPLHFEALTAEESDIPEFGSSDPEFGLLDQVMSRARAALDSLQEMIMPSRSIMPFANIQSRNVANPNVWNVPLPSQIFWDEPLIPRMLCIECFFQIHPIMRFELEVVEHEVKNLEIVLEATMLLGIVPKIHVKVYKKFLTKKLLEQQFVPVYIDIGGVPFEIMPSLRLDLKFLSRLNTQANIGFTAGYIGSIRAGLQYSSSSGMRSLSASYGDLVPENYSYRIGKKCEQYAGRTYNDLTIRECSALCDARGRSCVAFRYLPGLQQCTLTHRCMLQKQSISDEWLFMVYPWVKPNPSPIVTGVVVMLLQPQVTLMVNRIGGPLMVAGAAAVANIFRLNTSAECSRTEMKAKMYVVVGGRISVKAGSRTLHQDDVLLHPIYNYVARLIRPRTICWGNWTNENSQTNAPNVSALLLPSSEKLRPTGESIAKEQKNGQLEKGYAEEGLRYIGLCNSVYCSCEVQVLFDAGTAYLSLQLSQYSKSCEHQGVYGVSYADNGFLILKRISETILRASCALGDEIRIQVLDDRITLHRFDWCCPVIEMRAGSSVDLIEAGNSFRHGATMRSGSVSCSINELSTNKYSVRGNENLYIRSSESCIIVQGGNHGTSLNSLQSGKFLLLHPNATLALYRSLPFITPVWQQHLKDTGLRKSNEYERPPYLAKQPTPITLFQDRLLPGEVLYVNTAVYSDKCIFVHNSLTLSVYYWDPEGVVTELWSAHHPREDDAYLVVNSTNVIMRANQATPWFVYSKISEIEGVRWQNDSLQLIYALNQHTAKGSSCFETSPAAEYKFPTWIYVVVPIALTLFIVLVIKRNQFRSKFR